MGSYTRTLAVLGGLIAMYPNEATYDDVFWAAAQEQAARTEQYGVDAPTLFALAKAHAAVESGFSPTAYHWDGPDAVRNVSRGILQVEGQTAINLGLATGADTDTITGPKAPRDYITSTVFNRRTGMYDVNLAVPVGVRLIADNIVGTQGNLDQAIAAYNEGLPHALRDSYPFDNQEYVDAVNAKLAYFRALPPPTDPGAATGDGSNGVTPVAAGVGIAVLLGLAYALMRR